MQSISEILNIIKQKSYNIQKIARESSINADKIYKWLDGKGSPGYEDGNKLVNWAKENLDKIPSKHTRKTEPIDVLPGDNNEKDGHASITKALADVLASNRDLTLAVRDNSQAAKDNAASIKLIANSNAELVQMVKSRFIEDAALKKTADLEARMSSYLMKVAEVGVVAGKWASIEEAVAELNRSVIAPG